MKNFKDSDFYLIVTDSKLLFAVLLNIIGLSLFTFFIIRLLITLF